MHTSFTMATMITLQSPFNEGRDGQPQYDDPANSQVVYSRCAARLSCRPCEPCAGSLCGRARAAEEDMHARAQSRNAYSQVDKDPVAEAHKKEMEELRLVGACQLQLRFLSSMNTIPCLPVSASLCLCT